jgi:hypothetical protein
MDFFDVCAFLLLKVSRLEAKRRSCYCIFYEDQISNRFWIHGNQVSQDQLFETKEGYELDIHIKKIAHSMQLIISSMQTEKLNHMLKLGRKMKWVHDRLQLYDISHITFTKSLWGTTFHWPVLIDCNPTKVEKLVF